MTNNVYRNHKKSILAVTIIFAIVGTIIPVIGNIIFGLLGWAVVYLICATIDYIKLPKTEKEKLKAENQAEKEKLKAEKQAMQDLKVYAQKNKFKCPNCGSKNIQALGIHKKGFSVGKAVGGAVLTGGVGALAGFAGKKTKKTDFVCNECGRRFTL